jgi:hypothetical protein
VILASLLLEMGANVWQPLRGGRRLGDFAVLCLHEDLSSGIGSLCVAGWANHGRGCVG